jgi:hypothetical protein
VARYGKGRARLAEREAALREDVAAPRIQLVRDDISRRRLVRVEKRSIVHLEAGAGPEFSPQYVPQPKSKKASESNGCFFALQYNIYPWNVNHQGGQSLPRLFPSPSDSITDTPLCWHAGPRAPGWS